MSKTPTRKTASNGKPKPKARPRINLALQGGGAHGAFTWGVLDRFLEDDRYDIDGVSGTSAGAMNAVVLASGYEEGGSEGARKRLREFWEAVSHAGRTSPVQRSPLDIWLGNWSLDYSPSLALMDTLASVYSPYDFNPFDINPLRDIVEKHVNFDHLKACKGIKLFISATNVWNGKVKVFENEDMSLDAVMASACLPHLFKAVEIDGIPYWDGGYMGNPVLFPFFYETDCDDILLVQINPIERKDTPRTAREIANRVDEITFNSSLLKEFRAIDFVSDLIHDGKLSPDEYRNIRMHRVSSDGELQKLTSSSKLNAEPEFIRYLYKLGQASAQSWLEEHGEAIGETATLDLKEEIAYTLDGKDTDPGVSRALRRKIQKKHLAPKPNWLRPEIKDQD